MYVRQSKTMLAVSTVLAITLGGTAGVAAAELDGEALARQIIDATGVSGGLAVHVECGDGALAAALGARESFLVQGLAADAESVVKARAHVQSLGLYGPVAVDRLAGSRLPYVDNLATLVVCEDLAGAGITLDEVLRVLRPEGVAYVKGADGWTKTVKPRPDEIDRWTHYMHDAGGNAVAHDSLIGPPRRLQWIGSPRWSRHHDHMSSFSALVSTGERLFYIVDEGPRTSITLPPDWKLVARDAFNGTVLWKRRIANWHTRFWPLKSGPAQLPRRLVAVGNRVYATLALDGPVTVLDAATGETVRTLDETRAAEELIVSDGVLFAVVNDDPAGTKTLGESIADFKRRGNAWLWTDAARRIVAIDVETGRTLWAVKSAVAPLTLAADAERVYLHNGKEVVCLGRADGKSLWSVPLPIAAKITSNFGPTLVVHDDVVLLAGGEKLIPHRGGDDTVTALAAATGKKLWTAPHPPSGYQSPEDLFVAGGLVWCGATTNGGMSGVTTGRDLHSGEVKKQFPPTVETYWFHHRCYRGKATDRFLLTSRTGIEFLDLEAENWTINHWVRGACLYGVMPCNGMVYAPPHPCACYLEAKLYGFNALAPEKADWPSAAIASAPARLERGPAFDAPVDAAAAGDGADWPTYRGDASRSAFSSAAVPAELAPVWQTELGGKLSSPVIAAGRLFVAKIDTHQVVAVDAGSGERLWSFTAGGRVDSPPTVYRDRVLFGSADGHVYCLRADDGVLSWRFRAAPADVRITAFEQVESVWPVHGNVLVQDDVVSLVAGRSVFLDGGLRLCRLDFASGRLLSETVMDDRDPTNDTDLQDRIQILNMPVGLPDVLASDGRRLFMRSQVFDLEGKRQELGPHSGDPAGQGSVQRGEAAHLFSPTGLLDGSWWHRSYWVFGRSFAGGHAGYYQAGKFAPAGRILAFDDENVFGFGRKPQYYRWTTELEHHLFSVPKEAPVPPARGPVKRGTMVQFENTPALDPTGKPLAVEAWVLPEKGDGVILARGGPAQGYSLLLVGGKPRFAIRADEKLATVTARQSIVGRWTHLAGVLTPEAKLQIYVNGSLAGQADGTGLITGPPAQLMEIGADEGAGVGDYKSPFHFAGTIDEVRVYYGTVNADDVAASFADPGNATPKDAKRVLVCSFDNGKGRDASGLDNHGTVHAARSVAGKVGEGLRFARPTGTRGRTSLLAHHWTRDVPILVRGIALTDGRLFVAGPPDLVDEQAASPRIAAAEIREKLVAQTDALAGRLGASLLTVSTESGETTAELQLECPPVWDGMAVAGGRLYVVTMNGKVVCLGAK